MGHGGRCWVTDPDSQNFEAGKAATRMAYGKLIVCYIFNFSAKVNFHSETHWTCEKVLSTKKPTVLHLSVNILALAY